MLVSWLVATLEMCFGHLRWPVLLGPEHWPLAHREQEKVRFSFTFKTPGHFLLLFHPQVI
jgi:hypothetical protein